MNPVKLGLIGAGRIGQVYAQVLKNCEVGRITAVADDRREPAEAVAAELGCSFFDTFEDLAERAEVEAVLVCTPPHTHLEISKHFLARGINVMCEKPLAVSVEEARQMLDVAIENGVVLTMASKFRYVQDLVRARSIVASGILGDLILLENTFASRVDMTQRWNSDPTLAGGGVLIDNGTHSVDLVRSFLGPIAEVMAVEGRRVQELAVEDTAQLFLRSEQGERATIDLSWSIDKERASYLDIYGSQGTVQVGWQFSRYRQSSSPDWVLFGKGYDKVQAMGDQVSNFCLAIRGHETLKISAEDALASVQVVEAAYASMNHDGWVVPSYRGEGHSIDVTHAHNPSHSSG